MPDFFGNIPRGAGFGVFLAGSGLAAMAMMVGAPAGLSTPLWVALSGAACFVFAGASFIARTYGHPRMANMLALGVVWSLAVPGTWIALGGNGGCAALSTNAGGFTCRLGLGAGSAIILLSALTMTWTVLNTRRLPEAEARRA